MKPSISVLNSKGVRPQKSIIILGQVKGSLWRREELTEGQLNHHVHIVGASAEDTDLIAASIPIAWSRSYFLIGVNSYFTCSSSSISFFVGSF